MYKAIRPALLLSIGLAVNLIVCTEALSTTIINKEVNKQEAQATKLTSLNWQVADNLKQYHQQSAAIKAYDKKIFQQELDQAKLEKPIAALKNKYFGFDAKVTTDYFNTPQGQELANIILSYQTPSGAWSKRTDMSKKPRALGQTYGVENKYTPTFDNNATTTQIRLLAKAYQATKNEQYFQSIERAIKLILIAQYPSGGWPQTYPLVGGYNDDITLNDNVMINIMELLFDVVNSPELFAFLPSKLKTESTLAYQRSLNCIVKMQITSNGVKSVWAAQYDAKTLKPSKARAYEPISITTDESSALLNFLMRIKKPPNDIKQVIHSGVNWLKQQAMYNYKWQKSEEKQQAVLVNVAGAGPLWPRFIEIKTNRAIFGDRDHSIHYDVSEVSLERRLGYGWFKTSPKKTIKNYKAWLTKHS